MIPEDACTLFKAPTLHGCMNMTTYRQHARVVALFCPSRNSTSTPATMADVLEVLGDEEIAVL